MEHLQTGGIYAIEPILKTVAVLMKKIKTNILSENDFTKFLQLAQSSVNDLRKNDLFWPAFNALVGVQFQPKFDSDFLIHNFDKILEQSELVQGLALIMMNRISEENFEEFPDKFKVWCLAKCLTFGPIYKKDQILMNLTNEFIYSIKYNINYIEGSDHLVNTKVRSKGIELLLLSKQQVF